ncbi:hypothetical protein [Myxacorys almedinensis]|uniref:Uncharacterized protein n=1 Tax=Myxacorys almedinensis A TaxID=2690445 RepID=A0A8J7Z2C4_9CYAN|nr:hypothetical protein [Myxacorys almedinensis]NDJ16511.1 hypothetical protein [Myxacorys almedinensis A]
MATKKVKAGSNSQAPSAKGITEPSENNGGAETPLAETPVVAAEPVEPKEAIAAKPARASKKATDKQTVKADNPQPEPKKAAKKAVKNDSSEKAVKMKRLTLDISKPLHKAIKAKAVEEGVPMADMLRSLLERHYS